MSTLKVDGIRSNSASSDAITLASDGTCTANITNNLSNRRLTINGAMTIAQRGTSSTSNNGYYTVDRWSQEYGSVDEAPTFAQADVASGTTPYTLGFRKSYKVTNGNQTSGAGADDYILMGHAIEAQDIANSGWNYVSSSSNITLSFWVKSSVPQEFFGQVLSQDGSVYNYPFGTGSLSTDTWTKVTKTIPGNANLTFNNDNGSGLRIYLWPFAGTNLTGSVTQNAWGAVNWSERVPDSTSTWYTTNDATLEITGVQLEVGGVTDFEHKSFGQELALCQRYYYRATCDAVGQRFGLGQQMTSSAASIQFPLPTTMRTKPTALETSGTASDYSVARTSTHEVCNVVPTFDIATNHIAVISTNQTGASLSTGQCVQLRANGTGFYLGFSAEL